MARTRVEPWQAEDSVWRDSSLSTIIPSKRPSPKKSFNSVLKTNHLSNSVSNQKYLSDISSFHVPSSKIADSPKHALYHTSKPKSHTARKHSAKSKRHRDHHEESSHDFESTAVKVLAALHMSPDIRMESNEENGNKRPLELPDGDKRKNMVAKVVLRDIGHILRKAYPQLHVPSRNTVNNEDNLCQSTYSTRSPSPPSDLLGKNESERREVLCINSISPAVEELDEIIESLPEMSPTKIDKNIRSALAMSPKKSSSEASPLLNLPSFDILGAMAPSFAKAAAPAKAATPAKAAAPAKAAVPVTAATPPIFPSIASHSIKPVVPSVPSFFTSNTTRSVCPSPPLTETPLIVRSLLHKEQSSPKPQVMPICHIKNGFEGFPQEDGRKFKKTRFFVNTNILASSLDLLDLQKKEEVPSGSPYSCSFCDIVFSSVKHCKYHQSVISAEVTDVPDVQEDGFWLCPWCPIIALSLNYFVSHKEKCSEKGRCQQELKASSLRKNASASSRRRNFKPPSTASNTTVSPAKSSNSYKVLHGQVILV